MTGILNRGEVCPPVIREALKQADGVTINRLSPQVSALSWKSVIYYCVLVAEPLHLDFIILRWYMKLVLLGKKCGVSINKQEIPFEPLETFCKEQHLGMPSREDSIRSGNSCSAQMVRSSEKNEAGS